jgi:adenosylcobinamide kinase/adenosylcobinamide-phosphate guanylyltransferase
MRRDPASVTLVLGATRSGKSAVAEDLASRLAVATGGSVSYVATGSVADAGMARRVAAHQARRPETWETVELGPGADLPGVLETLRGTVLVDSLGTWVAGAPGLQVDAAALSAALRRREGPTVVVSEEVGFAVHPPTELGRRFVDELGQLNQAVAAVSGRVVLVVAGRTLELPCSALSGS